MEKEINEIYSKLLSDMVLPAKTYEKPFIITMCGHVGSGKSTIAKVFSNELEAYIVGGDKIRNIYFSNYNADSDINYVSEIVDEVLKREIMYLLANGISVVIDRSVSLKKTLDEIKSACPNVIMINLLSNHEINKGRIGNRDLHELNIAPCYGDFGSYSGVKTEELYNEILNRKVYDLDESDFDYTIDATKSIDEVVNEARKIAIAIKNHN